MRCDSLLLAVGRLEPELDAALDAIAASRRFRVMRVEHASTAAARLGGGGVSVVLLSCTPWSPSCIQAIVALRSAAAGTPLLAVCEVGDDAAGAAAVAAGAAAYLPLGRCHSDLAALTEALQHGRTPGGASVESPEPAGAGRIVAIAGAKGGVGVTTLAVNAATLLARDARVILAEIRPPLGGLWAYFRARRTTRGLIDLLDGSPAAIDAARLESCLWPCSAVPGLRILFGPNRTEPYCDPSPAQTQAVLAALARMADYVVLDLPGSLSPAARAAIGRAHVLALALERDPLCLPTARAVLDALEGWEVAPQLTGAVVVNRLPLAAPFALGEVETQLGVPLFAVIPPAADPCISARMANTPLVLCDPEGLAAAGIEQLTAHFRVAAPAPPAEGPRLLAQWTR
jgi:pilus assembly protein CpaE